MAWGAPGIAKLGPLGKKCQVLPREAGPTVQKAAWREVDLCSQAHVGAGDEALINGLNEPHSRWQQQAAVLLDGFIYDRAQLHLQLVARLAQSTHWRQRLIIMAGYLVNSDSSP